MKCKKLFIFCFVTTESFIYSILGICYLYLVTYLLFFILGVYYCYCGMVSFYFLSQPKGLYSSLYKLYCGYFPLILKHNDKTNDTETKNARDESTEEETFYLYLMDG